MYEFPVKRFYWSLSNDLSFKELPSLTEHYNDKINTDNSFFQGEPGRVIVSTKKEEGEEEVKEEGEASAEEGQVEKKELDSDKSDEEEVIVPKRDLTGK